MLELVLQPSDWFEGEERQRHSELVGKDPTIVFEVDDCRATYEQLRAQGVEFSLPPTAMGYGMFEPCLKVVMGSRWYIISYGTLSDHQKGAYIA